MLANLSKSRAIVLCGLTAILCAVAVTRPPVSPRAPLPVPALASLALNAAQPSIVETIDVTFGQGFPRWWKPLP